MPGREFINLLLWVARVRKEISVFAHQCEELVSPGTVAALLHGSDLQLSTWGVVLPYDYWAQNSRRRDVIDFEDRWSEYKRVPVLEFAADENWRFTYRHFANSVCPLCHLGEFKTVGEEWSLAQRILDACSLRDGARYYRELHRELVRLSSKMRTEITPKSLAKENPQGQRLIAHAQAIRKWLKEKGKM